MSGDEARERANFCEETNLVNLSDYSIQYLSLEGPKHNGFVFDRIHNKTSTGLYHARSYVVNGGDSNHKVIDVF